MSVVTLANGRSFVAERGSVLDAALAHGLTLEHSCRTGRCGSCKVRVLDGRTVPILDETSLTAEEIAAGWILTCAREAQGDVSLDAEDLSALAGLAPKTLPCRIDAIEPTSTDVRRVRLRLPPNAGFAFRAGQYLDVSGPGGVKRSYSVASAMGDATIELHIRAVDGGAMSRYWFEAARRTTCCGCAGRSAPSSCETSPGSTWCFWRRAPATHRSIRCLRSSRRCRPKNVRGPRTSSGAGGTRRTSTADPTRLHADLRFVPVVSRPDGGWDGARGHVQDALLASGIPLAGAAVYACGSDAMIHSARAALVDAGLNARRFFSDAFVSSS